MDAAPPGGTVALHLLNHLTYLSQSEYKKSLFFSALIRCAEDLSLLSFPDWAREADYNIIRQLSEYFEADPEAISPDQISHINYLIPGQPISRWERHKHRPNILSPIHGSLVKM